MTGHTDFSFEDAPNTAAFMCRHVLRERAAVLQVFHDPEGDWQFLCGAEHETSDIHVVCLGEALKLDPSVGALSGLCIGRHAERTDRKAPWREVDGHEAFIREHVGCGQWAVSVVEAGASADEPEFAYTTGLFKNFRHPELIIIGLRRETMHSVLNTIGERIKAGERFADGDRLEGVIERYELQLKEVKEPRSFEAHVGYSLWFYQGQRFGLLQVLYPDRDNRFPGDPGTTAGFRAQQPVLP